MAASLAGRDRGLAAGCSSDDPPGGSSLRSRNRFIRGDIPQAVDTPSATPVLPPLEQLDRRLAVEASKEARSKTFDMDDEPDRAVLAAFQPLGETLRWLDEVITTPWREADGAAI